MPLRLMMSLALLGLVLARPLAAADKLEKEDKKWLDEVAPLILPEEEKQYRELSKADRPEFQRIFWARRDPSPETPQNEFQAEYQKLRSEADTKFRVSGRAGGATDCGRVYVLLGAPDEVKPEPSTEPTPGRRARETWVFRDRPGMNFQSGEIQIGFDEECQLPPGARLADQLRQLAAAKIVQPNLDYKKTSDGRLVKLADQLPKPSPAQSLLKAPRQDFPVAAETKMVVRTEGGSYVAGLLRGDVTALALQDAGGKKTARVVVATQAVAEGGGAVSGKEREAIAEVSGDSFFVSYGMALRPGKYTLKVATLDPGGKKGSVASLPVEMPDYASGQLMLSPVLILRDIQENQTLTPQDPFADFAFGSTRLVPSFGNLFAAEDSVMVLCFIYNPTVDPATGKPSTTVGVTIEKDGKVLARAQDNTYDTPTPAHMVGPVPLQKYGPGTYIAKVKVRDNVAGKDDTQEGAFEVKAAP